MDDFECDFCGERQVFSRRRVVALPRPSTPDTLVAVLWGCGLCAESAGLPSAVEVSDVVALTGEWRGERVLFVEV